FKRHGWFILIATVIVIALIGQRYTNQTKMQEIKRLEKELAQSKSIEINEKAKYMSLIRENEMRKLLKEKHLDLDYQEQPPYVISKN
ncbi:MAG: FtsL-like putative cell division protein, partial [Lachnospiraceae bacterium]|nr:FtsL-like putative cell division protein [Lachnospiraceae bacterium]